MNRSSTRRRFLGLLALCVAATPILEAEAKGRGGGGRRSASGGRHSSGGGRGGGSGGCGSRGGPGYRKANGKCASWRD